jgi:hypothetical protein
MPIFSFESKGEVSEINGRLKISLNVKLLLILIKMMLNDKMLIYFCVKNYDKIGCF